MAIKPTEISACILTYIFFSFKNASPAAFTRLAEVEGGIKGHVAPAQSMRANKKRAAKAGSDFGLYYAARGFDSPWFPLLAGRGGGGFGFRRIDATAAVVCKVCTFLVTSILCGSIREQIYGNPKDS